MTDQSLESAKPRRGRRAGAKKTAKRAGRRGRPAGSTTKQAGRRAGRPAGRPAGAGREDKLRFVLDWLAQANNLDRLYNLIQR